jgi:hypothetical protein
VEEGGKQKAVNRVPFSIVYFLPPSFPFEVGVKANFNSRGGRPDLQLGCYKGWSFLIPTGFGHSSKTYHANSAG